MTKSASIITVVSFVVLSLINLGWAESNESASYKEYHFTGELNHHILDEKGFKEKKDDFEASFGLRSFYYEDCRFSITLVMDKENQFYEILGHATTDGALIYHERIFYDSTYIYFQKMIERENSAQPVSYPANPIRPYHYSKDLTLAYSFEEFKKLPRIESEKDESGNTWYRRTMANFITKNENNPIVEELLLEKTTDRPLAYHYNSGDKPMRHQTEISLEWKEGLEVPVKIEVENASSFSKENRIWKIELIEEKETQSSPREVFYHE